MAFVHRGLRQHVAVPIVHGTLYMQKAEAASYCAIVHGFMRASLSSAAGQGLSGSSQGRASRGCWNQPQQGLCLISIQVGSHQVGARLEPNCSEVNSCYVALLNKNLSQHMHSKSLCGTMKCTATFACMMTKSGLS